MGISTELARKILSDEIDIYDAVAYGEGCTNEEHNYLENLYDEIAAEHFLHRDDASEEIMERIYDCIYDDFGEEAVA